MSKSYEELQKENELLRKYIMALCEISAEALKLVLVQDNKIEELKDLIRQVNEFLGVK